MALIRSPLFSAAFGLFIAIVPRCTGGLETAASETAGAVKTTTVATDSAPKPAPFDARKKIGALGPSIPIYAGADYDAELSRRDLVTVRNQYGPQAEVFTLTTDDSFPQVWHYYITYLAQYRAFEPPNPYPPENQTSRSKQISLNEAMQDPFIPGDALTSTAQLTLQLSESESRPRTVIRYILTQQPISSPVSSQ